MGVILPNIFREINHQLEYYPGRKGGELGVDIASLLPGASSIKPPFVVC
jgi:hypothetical protein